MTTNPTNRSASLLRVGTIVLFAFLLGEGKAERSGEMVTANELLRELLGTVAVWPDETARDGLRVEIRSSAVRLFLGDRNGRNANGLPREAALLLSQVSLAARTGSNLHLRPEQIKMVAGARNYRDQHSLELFV
ncbi:hypothetical protein [Paracoccus luteus]|uniref:hypothetical protein n=1 Tax=Paracoccus luteus TaxID=2508543 RepID=UPI00106F4F0A|nr:hypothetical protein [Paracoccus luteus]